MLAFTLDHLIYGRIDLRSVEYANSLKNMSELRMSEGDLVGLNPPHIGPWELRGLDDMIRFSLGFLIPLRWWAAYLLEKAHELSGYDPCNNSAHPYDGNRFRATESRPRGGRSLCSGC